MTREQKFGVGLLALILFLLWWLSKKGLLHESVTSRVLTGSATAALTDPVTGAHAFDANSVPDNEEAAFAPLSDNGVATFHPANPKTASCPIGSTLWKNNITGGYECIPN